MLTAYVLSTGVSTTFAQPYPNRPIQLIIPNVAGSIVDIISRLFAEDLGKVLSTQIIPINKPGATTIVGTDALARSKKDGYTLGTLSNAVMVFTRILNPETIHFDWDKDLEPLGLHTLVPLAVGVQGNAPWKTFNELLDYAKKNSGKVRLNSIGIGSTAHFNIEIIHSLTGHNLLIFLTKGGNPSSQPFWGGTWKRRSMRLIRSYPIWSQER